MPGPLVVVGDALLDVDLVGRAGRLSPDAPVPVLDDLREVRRPGGAALAAAALQLGFYLSFSGIVSFPKSDALRAVAATVPAERLLIETDSPYLAPVPHRGKRNEPAFVADTAAFVAGLRDVSPDELAATTTANFFRLFNKAAPAR